MTIPRHLIDKAAQGIDEFLADLQRGDSENFPRHLAAAALEAAAADIWDQGFDAGERDVWEHEYGSYDDPCIPNPYRASGGA